MFSLCGHSAEVFSAQAFATWRGLPSLGRMHQAADDYDKVPRTAVSETDRRYANLATRYQNGTVLAYMKRDRKVVFPFAAHYHEATPVLRES